MEAFAITGSVEQSHFNELILSRLRTIEERHRTKSSAAGKRVLGAKILTEQAFNLYYRPKRSGNDFYIPPKEFLASYRKRRARAAQTLEDAQSPTKYNWLRQLFGGSVSAVR